MAPTRSTIRSPASHLSRRRRFWRCTSSAVTGIIIRGLLAASACFPGGADLLSGSLTPLMIEEHETGALDYGWRVSGQSRTGRMGLYFTFWRAHPRDVGIGKTHHQQSYGTHRRD